MQEKTWQEQLSYLYIAYFPYWAWLVVAVILGLGVTLLIYPLWNTIQATGAFEYSRLVEEQSARQQELDQLKLMRDQLSRLNQSQLLYVQDTLPQDLLPAELMEQVASTFERQGLQVQSIDVVDESSESAPVGLSAIPGITPLQLTVNVTGDASYEGLKKFLHEVSSSNPIFDLYSIGYSSERKSFSVVFTTYVAE